MSLGVDSLTTDADRTKLNPLRGFLTSYAWAEPANDFPTSLEFFYIQMADLWDQSGDTLSAGLEPSLAAAAARGHHAVVRVYIDYPSKPSGLPPYLDELVNCTEYTDHGGGCSPDYDDPDLIAGICGLVEALGAAYDGDPRLGFVQVGLLGFWGEWHTWPHTEIFASESTQELVLEAFAAAFKATHVQLREPHANSHNFPFGYHDDSFAYSTIGDVGWFFGARRCARITNAAVPT